MGARRKGSPPAKKGLHMIFNYFVLALPVVLSAILYASFKPAKTVPVDCS